MFTHRRRRRRLATDAEATIARANEAVDGLKAA